MTHNSAASKNSNDDSSGTRTPGSPEMNEKSDDNRGDRNNDINVESIKEEKVSNMMNSSPMDHQMNKEGKNPRIITTNINFEANFKARAKRATLITYFGAKIFTFKNQQKCRFQCQKCIFLSKQA